MILIDAVFINNGGGKVLLDYLVSNLTTHNFNFVLLLDKRLEPYPFASGYETHYAGNLSERSKFYSIHQYKFKKVFCLGNIPLKNKIDGSFINYLHSTQYVTKIDRGDIRNYLLTNLKKIYFSRFVKNVDLWIVQTATMKENLLKSQKIFSDKVKILPFYEKMNVVKDLKKINNQFLYVSNGSLHKNHIRLINAFCKFYDRSKEGVLILTVSDYCKNIVEIVNKKVSEGYPIKNYGFVERDQLIEIYSSSPFVIYPSLTESFGLGLVEAISFNCKIIASNLDFVHDICVPSATFNPMEETEISAAFSNAISRELPTSVLKIEDEINKILELLRNNVEISD